MCFLCFFGVILSGFCFFGCFFLGVKQIQVEVFGYVGYSSFWSEHTGLFCSSVCGVGELTMGIIPMTFPTSFITSINKFCVQALSMVIIRRDRTHACLHFS